MSIENSVRLIGNLGEAPQLKYAQNGTAIARFSLATTRRFKDKDGQKQEDTSWHRVVAFGKTAELAGEYLSKGSKIAVEGRLKYEQYEKDGVTKYSTDIIIEQMTFLSGKREEGGQRNERQQQQQPQRQAPPMDDFQDDPLNW